MAKTMWLVLAVSIAVAALAPPQTEAAAITCTTVANDLSPCFNYVLYGGFGQPPVNCCTGIKNLYGQARSTPDRQTVCSCLKNVARSASDPVIAAAAGLPGKCGVNIPYQISPNVDCSTVH